MADKKSHIGLGILVGSIIGVAAGLFIQSKKGKQMTKDLEKRAMKLQSKLMKELENAKDLTKEKYEGIVDNVVAYYVKSKEIAKKEAPEIRSFLVTKWKHIEQTMKNA